MEKKINRLHFLLLILIIALGFFLRAYRLRDFMLFLGDQGRDVWVVKKMVLDGKFTLLGPVASVGGFYLGPLYYYLITPFLMLTKFDPIGPAIFIVITGSLTPLLIFLYLRKKINLITGLIAAFLYAISPVLIQFNRFSWNPNLVPLFTILFYISLEKGILEAKRKYVMLSGILLGGLLQLHYLAFIYFPVVFLLVLLFSRHRFKQAFLQLLTFALGVIIGWSPFIVYELRHSFQNFGGLAEFLSRKDAANVGFDFNRYISSLKANSAFIIYNLFHLPQLANILTRFLVVGYILYQILRGKNIKRLLSYFVLFSFLILCLYKGKMEAHYLNIIYVFVIIIIADVVRYIFQINKIFALILLLYISYNSYQVYYFHQEPNHQLDQTIDISKFVFEKVKDRKFNFALITKTNSDHAYRYFFDLWGNPSVEILADKSESVTDTLIVLCEPLTKNCDPRGSPLWEILGFGKFYIARQWHRHVYWVYELKHPSSSINQN